MTIPGLELRSAWRRLLRRPVASIAALVTIAVAVGASVAVFALVDELWLRPLRFSAPERLVTLWDTEASGATSNVGWQTFADVREQSRSLEGAAALSYWAPTLTGEGEAERLAGLRASGEIFALLGVRPAVGRFFEPAEDVRGAHMVVVLSHSLWTRRFGADPAIVGRTIRLGTYEYRVVGVLPADFDDVLGLTGQPAPEIWAPLGYNATLEWACRSCRHLRVVGRLRPDVTLAAARQEIDAVARAIAAENPSEYAAAGMHVIPLAETVFRPFRPVVTALGIAVALLGAMAVANLMGLSLANVVTRESELAVRGALGARRWDLFRLPVLEASLLGASGGALGVVAAHWILRGAQWLAPPYLPRVGSAAIGGREVGVALALALMIAWASSLAAALAAGRATALAHGSPTRQTAGRRPRRLLALLVAADLAIGFVLWTAAGLMGKSLMILLAQAPGFRTDGVVTLELGIIGKEEASLPALYDSALERLHALPGVAAAAFSSQLPLGGDFDRYGVHPEGGNGIPELDPSADRYSVSASFLETLGLPLVGGRFIAASDRGEAAPVAVVSSALAARLYPSGALGRQVKVGGTDGPWRTIVGVVGDVRHNNLEAKSDGAIYLPFEQFELGAATTLAVRGAGDAAALGETVRRALRELDPDISVSKVATYETLTARSVQTRRFSATLLGGFAAVALCLVVVGVYGVVALVSGERRREMGVRRALGASYGDLGRALLGRLGVLALAGIGTGLAGALAFGGALRSQLYNVPPTDPSALALACAVLFLVAAVAAAAGPAIRAARVDPAESLRAE